MILQSAFTVAVHSRAVFEDRRLNKPPVIGGFLLLLIATFVVGTIGERFPLLGHNAGELIYRLFMAFYGLIFPAYVWLCMIPTQPPNADSGHKFKILLATILLAAPMFWLGFIADRMIWLAPGLGAVLVARVFAVQRHSNAPVTAVRSESNL